MMGAFRATWGWLTFHLTRLSLKRSGSMSQSVFKSLNNYKSIVVSGVIAVIGLFLLIMPQLFPSWNNHPRLLLITSNLGGLLVASLSLSIIWELTIKRSFLYEIYEVSKISSALRESGLSGVSFDFYRLDWEGYFQSAKEVDIFLTYGGSWRGAVENYIKSFALRTGVKIRLILPDPENQLLVSELARRFNKTEAEMKSRIERAISEFNVLLTGKSCDYKLYLTTCAPLYGYYKFDRKMAITIFTQGVSKTSVPTFLIDGDGALPNFFINDFDHLIAQARLA